MNTILNITIDFILDFTVFVMGYSLGRSHVYKRVAPLLLRNLERTIKARCSFCGKLRKPTSLKVSRKINKETRIVSVFLYCVDNPECEFKAINNLEGKQIDIHFIRSCDEK